MINWLGNKLKYLNYLEHYSRNFETIIDPMMGSGNILVELIKEHKIIGNDIIKLMPNIYSNYSNFCFKEKDFKRIISRWKFDKKKHYYDFRDYWNGKYLRDDYNKDFLIETFLLVKMCSNSVVRFNLKGEFNSGFRGLSGNPFFEKKKINEWEEYLEKIKENLLKNDSTFFVCDVLKFLNFLKFDINNSFFIFDPPYTLQEGCYSPKLYNRATESRIFDFILRENVNFVYFNFLSREEDEHENLKRFVDDGRFNVINLKEKSATGQNRKGTAKINEVLITNLG